nr:MAG TPA_asm: hypothetical protein [Caudoviricetes sp.]
MEPPHRTKRRHPRKPKSTHSKHNFRRILL